ncbi:MAG: hypothetical protein DIZ80_03700 [endosymbiont of Galathealinum brachiosum]|uniref:histidine kinase n=1 Tax=endosymbiont of Galathealinum brachiosum TaxID=2200906 RepID=A0A370DI40_9GAMM|nr:MAG: hypothetical protein DIZ80_03700 [endosymbiont of Galathealinum brachiosum]
MIKMFKDVEGMKYFVSYIYRYIKTLLLILMFMFVSSGSISAEEFLSDSEKKWIIDNPEIKFTGDPNWLPYEAFNADGNYVGIVADHLKIIENKTGLRFKSISVNTWSSSLQIAMKGEVSVISGDIADVNLNKNFNPVESYSRNPVVIIMGSHQNYIENLNEIKNKKIVLIKDYGYTSLILNQYPEFKFIEVENIQQGLSGIAEGRFDAMLATMALASYNIAEMGLHNVKVVGKTPIVMDLTLFVDKNEPVLYSIIEKSLKTITEKESYAILENWIKDKYIEKTDYQYIVRIIIFFVIIVAIFFYWNRRLTQEISLRLEIEKNLKESERFLKRSQEISHIGNWKLNIETNQVWASDELKNIIGFDGENLTVEAFIDVIHPDDKDLVISSFNRGKSGENRDVEYRCVVGGNIKWLHGVGGATLDDSGKVTEVYGTIQDVTKQKIVENEAVESRSRFEAMFKSIPDAIVFIDQNRSMKMFNSAALEMFGYQEDEIVGEKFEILYTINDDIKDTNKNKFDTNFNFIPLPYEITYKRKNGNVFQGETVATSVASSAGDVLGHLAIVRDISERGHVEAILRSLAAGVSGLEFDSFIDDVLDRLTELYSCKYAFIGLLTEDGNHVKTLAVKIDGKRVENFEYELKNTPCKDVLNRKKELISRDAATLYPEDKMLVEMGIESYFGSPLVTLDGSLLGILTVMDVNEMEIDEWTEPVLGVFSTRVSLELERDIANQELSQHRDHLEELVTQRTIDLSSARDEAEQANVSKSDFLSRMSHELRTPLNAILGFGQMLELDVEGFSDIQKDNVNEILDAGNHLLMLINEVLDLAKIESGKLDIDITKVSVNDVIDQCISLTGPQADTREIEIIDQYSSNNLIVFADSIRLKQILINLISNAVKYNNEKGLIRVKAFVTDKDVARICISDTGNGLSEEEIDKLFTPFERLNAVNNVEGTGIGLVICKRLIELMNGKIGIESINGKGSTFWIELKLVNDD